MTEYDKKFINTIYVIRRVFYKILDTYSQLHDWKEYLSWYDEYKNILQSKEDLSDESKQFLENKIDINYLK